MSDKRFRFGVVGSPRTGDEWIRTARQAADLGYSTVLMPDGLQLPSPFPSLAMAAAVARWRSSQCRGQSRRARYRNAHGRLHR